MNEIVHLLAQVPLLAGVTELDLDRLASATHPVSFGPGENIVEIGTPGQSLFIILSGNVQVLYPARGTDFELARLGPGDFFGEMALLNDRPRSATVRSVDGTEALALGKKEFRQVVMETPRLAIELLEALSVRIRNADEHISSLSDQAMRDPLTGLLNRRAFQERLAEEADRARRYGTSFSLILIDLDEFKRINDTLGHDVGDTVLTWVGRILLEHTRASDCPFRIGGEEFAVLCTSTGPETAAAAARRLVEVVGEARPPLEHGIRVTMSGGYASCPDHAEDFEELYGLADRALLRAKTDGRNRVCDPLVEGAGT